MQKKKKICWQQKWTQYAVAFLLPFFILLIIFALLGIYPFGQRTLLVIDLRDQYIDFFSYLKSALAEGDSLLYTFSKNLGGEMISLIAYYLISPFNVVLFFFSQTKLHIAATLLILLKISACGISFYHYLNQKFKERKINLLFSTTYAFMGYISAYFYNVMWLDAMVFLPLLILGIERIVAEKRASLYLFSLFFVLICNYYIAYMICIFAVLYFLYYSLISDAKEKKSSFWKNGLRFAGASLVAVCLAAALLLPTALSLSESRMGLIFSTPVKDVNFSFIEALSKFLTNSFSYLEIQKGLPNLFIGMLPLFLTMLYFCNQQITRKEKLCSGLLLGILFFSMVYGPVNLLWHGNSQPVWYPYRYSFLISFLMILFSYRTFVSCKEGMRVKHIWIAYFIYLMLFICLLFVSFEYLTQLDIILNILLLTIFAFLLSLLLTTTEQKAYRSFLILLVVTHFLNLGLHTYNTLDEMTAVVGVSANDYEEAIGQTSEVIHSIQSEDNGFYRLEKDYRRDFNDSMQYNYAGLTHFSSTEKMQVKNFLGYLGYRNAQLWAQYEKGTTSAAESLLGVKYILNKTPYTARDAYQEKWEENGITVFKNPYALPIAFFAAQGVTAINVEQMENPFVRLNAIYKGIAAKGTPVFERAIPKSISLENITVQETETDIIYWKEESAAQGSITYKFVAEKESPLYFYIDAPYRQEAEIYVNQIYQGKYFDYYEWDAQSLGRFAEGEEIEVSIVFTSNYLRMETPSFYYENMSVLGQYIYEIRDIPVETKKESSAHLVTTVAAEKAGFVLYSIPHEEAWKITVDGTPIKSVEAFGALLAVPVTAGEHEIILRYEPRGLSLGLIITGVTIMGLTLYYVLKWRKKRKNSLLTFPLL